MFKPVVVGAASAFLLSACASTPTVEEANAQAARVEAGCRAKGYKPATREFETCITLAAQADAQSRLNTMTAAQMGIFGATLLSDARVKRDIVPIGKRPDGLPLYRFRYQWSDRLYVGVIAQDVLATTPAAVQRGADGYLRVDYDRIGLQLITWDDWLTRSH